MDLESVVSISSAASCSTSGAPSGMPASVVGSGVLLATADEVSAVMVGKRAAVVGDACVSLLGDGWSTNAFGLSQLENSLSPHEANKTKHEGMLTCFFSCHFVRGCNWAQTRAKTGSSLCRWLHFELPVSRTITIRL